MAEITFPEMVDQNGEVEGGNVIRLDHNSYARMKYRSRSEEIQQVRGNVTVFNPNTFNGRIFVPAEGRNIPFFLTPAGRSPDEFRLIGDSYSKNLLDRTDESALLEFDVLANLTKLGALAKYTIIKVRVPREGDDEFLEEF